MVGGRNITAILTGEIVKGFGKTVVKGWVHGGWPKYYIYSDRRNSGGVYGKVPSAEEHFITKFCKPWLYTRSLRESITMVVRQWVCIMFISRKFCVYSVGLLSA
jgi:hypothetical protein